MFLAFAVTYSFPQYHLAGRRFVVLVFGVASSSCYSPCHVPRKVGERQATSCCPSSPFLAVLPA